MRSHGNRGYCVRVLVAGFVLGLVGLQGIPLLQAATLYWAPGNDLGAAGTWSAVAEVWSVNADGSGTLQALAPGDTAEFRSTAKTVTVDGAVETEAIRVALGSGAHTFSPINSGTIALNSGALGVPGGITVTLNTPISGTNGLDRSNGSGTCILNVANPSLTGDIRGSGFTTIAHVSALPSSGSLEMVAGNTRVNLQNHTLTFAGLIASTPASDDNNLSNRRIAAHSGGSGTASLILDRGGSETLSFYGRFGNGTVALGIDLTKRGSYTQVLRGVLATENSNATVLRIEEGTLVFQKNSGKYVWSASSGSRIEVAGGELRWAANDQVAATMPFKLSGGVMDLAGYRNTDGLGNLVQFGTLDLQGAAAIDFGDLQTGEIWFADSSAVAWGGGASLNIVNFAAGTSVLRFGTSNSALTPDHLSRISIGGAPAALNADGFVFALPRGTVLVLQ